MKIPANNLCLVLGLGFLAAFSLGPFTGCAGGRNNQGTREYREYDDQSLQLSIRTALNDNPGYKFDGVSITVVKGKAQLGGFVGRFSEKVAAGDIAKRVPGVKQIEDNIVVEEPDRSGTNDSVEDQSLTTSVENNLTGNPDYKYEEVSVDAFRGVVQLSGFVNTTNQKVQADQIARTIPGVKDVLNNIIVKERR